MGSDLNIFANSSSSRTVGGVYTTIAWELDEYTFVIKCGFSSTIASDLGEDEDLDEDTTFALPLPLDEDEDEDMFVEDTGESKNAFSSSTVGASRFVC